MKVVQNDHFRWLTNVIFEDPVFHFHDHGRKCIHSMEWSLLKIRENQSYFSVDFCCKLQEFGPGKKGTWLMWLFLKGKKWDENCWNLYTSRSHRLVGDWKLNPLVSQIVCLSFCFSIGCLFPSWAQTVFQLTSKQKIHGTGFATWLKHCFIRQATSKMVVKLLVEFLGQVLWSWRGGRIIPDLVSS